jgi:hypothetical protein
MMRKNQNQIKNTKRSADQDGQKDTFAVDSDDINDTTTVSTLSTMLSCFLLDSVRLVTKTYCSSKDPL